MNRKAVEALRESMVRNDAEDDVEWTVENLRARGYAIVPLEPTEGMVEAGNAAIQSTGFVTKATKKGWAVMVAAALEDGE